MEYEDRLKIVTPEGVELELQLAGLGSRFIAQSIDLLIKSALILLIVIAVSWAGLTGVAIILPSIALVLYAYDVVFETFSNGRTPGKRAARLRVVRVGGVPTFYVPGMVSILATKKNQRLGDLAAGTIVIHEEPAVAPRPGMPPPGAGAWAPPSAPPGWQAGPVWDVSRVTP